MSALAPDRPTGAARDATDALRGWHAPAVAAKANVARAEGFALCGMVVIVGQIEGTVQLMFATEGWAGRDGRRAVITNVFADAATPAELRALADHLDGLVLEGVG